jgi:class 3 adenylate cyclase
VQPAIRELLEAVPTTRATVIVERIGWKRSMTVLKDRVRELCPLSLGPSLPAHHLPLRGAGRRTGPRHLASLVPVDLKSDNPRRCVSSPCSGEHLTVRSARSPGVAQRQSPAFQAGVPVRSPSPALWAEASTDPSVLSGAMPIFMDVHRDLGAVTEDDIAAAHQRDLEVQAQFGVRFLTFWFNQPDGSAFCLVEAPDESAAVACHKASHGLVPHDIVQVERPTVDRFMGDWEPNVPDVARLAPGGAVDTGLRAIMFTDLEGSTAASSRHGDLHAIQLIERHDWIVRSALKDSGGREVKHTGDGILASFSYVSRAVDCAVAIQRSFGGAEGDGPGGQLRIGLSAGEPVDRHEDIFGAAVNLAARICAHADPGQILVSAAVRELAVGKALRFLDRGQIALKGFDEPVRLYQVGTIA